MADIVVALDDLIVATGYSTSITMMHKFILYCSLYSTLINWGIAWGRMEHVMFRLATA